MKFTQELIILLKARYPIIYVNTSEENRVEYLIRKTIKSNLNRSIYTWDFIEGYTNNPNNPNFGKRNPLQALELIEKLTSETPAIFILKDFNHFLKDVSISRKLKNLLKILKLQPKTILIISSEIDIPIELQDFITVLNFQLPTKEEIEIELLRLTQSLNLEISEELLENLSRASQGLSMERIRRVLSKIITLYKIIDENSVSLVLKEKQEIIKQTQILEYWPVKEKIDNIGGMLCLKNWLKQRTNSFSQKAINYGLPTPRGLLLVGIQGTGKSLTAKIIAANWQLPLLKLDIGKIFGGIVGESEARLRKMIETAEVLSPCILWIDEIDKVFSKNQSSGDSGTSNRVLATFISWLSEKTEPVFVVATANDISLLPLEIIRKGRFDEIFFLDLPTKVEREEIFRIHLRQFRPETYMNYNIKKLSEKSQGFSGAEIRQSIIDSMYLAFSEEREFIDEDIYSSLKQTIPLAYLNENKIKELQNWALSGRIRLAS